VHEGLREDKPAGDVRAGNAVTEAILGPSEERRFRPFDDKPEICRVRTPQLSFN
jgi:hypothetical protein